MRAQTFQSLAGNKKPIKRLRHQMVPRRRMPDGFSGIRVITADAEYSVKPSEIPAARPRKRVLPKVKPLSANATRGSYRAL